jgi:hypothetical protein
MNGREIVPLLCCATLTIFSDESKSIGKFEYLKKSVDVTQQLLQLEPEIVPFPLLHSILEFSMANRSLSHLENMAEVS